MKNSSSSIRLHLVGAAAVLFLAIALFACKKSNLSNNNTPVAALMAFNLAPDKPAVRISLSGNTLTPTPLSYTSYTGGYLNIYPGSRPVESFDNNSSASFASVSYNFDTSKYYSLYVVGNNGTYSNIITNDNFDSLSATNGMAYVRYINAVNGQAASLVNITSGGSNIFNTTAPFASISNFAAVNPGDITVSVNNEGGTPVSRTITIETKKIYTVLLVGVSGSTDTEKAVQIKFISNGTL